MKLQTNLPVSMECFDEAQHNKNDESGAMNSKNASSNAKTEVESCS